MLSILFKKIIIELKQFKLFLFLLPFCFLTFLARALSYDYTLDIGLISANLLFYLGCLKKETTNFILNVKIRGRFVLLKIPNSFENSQEIVKCNFYFYFKFFIFFLSFKVLFGFMIFILLTHFTQNEYRTLYLNSNLVLNLFWYTLSIF